MTFKAWWDVCDQALTDTEEARAFLAHKVNVYNPWGTRGLALWFGREGDDWMGGPLRLDLDPDAGRAALRWLPDDSHAVELDIVGPINVLEDSGRPMVVIPAELARVSIRTGCQAVVDYVTTGQQPTRVRWEKPTTLS